MFNSVLNYEFENIKGKIAIISDETNLASALFTIKKIKNSEIDLYIQTKDSTILINDIKDLNSSMICSESPVFEYSVSEIFSPFEYNAVICLGESNAITQISENCNKYATPVISKNSCHLLYN